MEQPEWLVLAILTMLHILDSASCLKRCGGFLDDYPAGPVPSSLTVAAGMSSAVHSLTTGHRSHPAAS